MKVIGAGFSRTGTTSMREALETLLGGPCYHMDVIMKRGAHLKAWHDLSQGRLERMDWRWLLADYQACVDLPVCAYYEELMEAFPDAKVVLTVREPQSWFGSWQTLMDTSDRFRPLIPFVPRVRRLFEFCDKLIIDDIFGGVIESEPNIEVFLRHNEEVKAAVPPERLLVFDVRDGWQPLCDFLELPVPDKPFPHLNAGGEGVKGMFQDLTGRGIAGFVIAAVVVLALIGAGLWWWFAG